MRGIWAALQRHAWLLLVFVVVVGAFGLVPQDFALVGLIGIPLIGGAIAAIVWPAHPLRNGTLGGILAWYVGVPAGLAVQTVLGTIEIAEGETVGSFWLELPFWLTLFVPIAIIAGFIAGVLAFLATRITHRPIPG
jgi:hypothetical protein